jgi:hypothetical protein
MGMKTISPRRQSRPQEIARMQDFAPFTPELLGAFIFIYVVSAL